MTPEKLAHIKFALRDMAFRDIERASAGNSKMGAFILASCFIEYMAGFIAGCQTTRRHYKLFVKDYLPSLYDPEKMYNDLRCDLVHNYSEGGSYLFVDAKPDLHGHNQDKKTIINLENFIADLDKALSQVLGDLDKDAGKRKNAEKRYDEIGLLCIVPIVKP